MKMIKMICGLHTKERKLDLYMLLNVIIFFKIGDHLKNTLKQPKEVRE